MTDPTKTEGVAQSSPRGKKKEILYFYGGLVLLTAFVSVGGLLYHKGYRLESLHLARTGSLEVAVYEAGSRIYLDNILEQTTSAGEERLTFSNLSPDKHVLIVSKDGYQIWKKDLTIASEKTVKVSTFLLPTGLKTEKIEDREEKRQIEFLFAHSATPTSLQKRIFQNTAIWADGKAIYAQWIGDANSIPPYLCPSTGECKNTPVLIFTAPENVSNVDFYKDREDVLIISHSKSIDVIEMNGEGGREFHSLYAGTENTSFFKEANGSLYIENGKDVFRMKL